MRGAMETKEKSIPVRLRTWHGNETEERDLRLEWDAGARRKRAGLGQRQAM